MYRLRSAPVRPFVSAVCLVFATSWAGCTAPGPIPGSPPPRSTAVPEWVGSSLSWRKLDEIEAWQATEAHRASPFWQVEAELQLAEGRLEFAENALAGADLEGRGRDRIATARAGFERVLSDGRAIDGQRRRAELGTQRCSALVGASRPVLPTAAGDVVLRDEWDATPGRPANMNRHSGGWNKITVHHSAMSDPLPLSGSQADSSAAVRRIQRAHMKSSGYGDIGYHFLIDPSGRVFQGRELTYQGAHAGGSNNVGNIGICLIGNFDHDRPTRAALDTLDRLVGGLRSRFSISASRVVAHSDLKSTNCPGRHLRPWVERYRASLARR